MEQSITDPILQKARELSDDELAQLIYQLQELQKQKAQPVTQEHPLLDEEEYPPGSGKRLAKLSELWGFESEYSDTAERSREILKEGFADHITRKMDVDE